MTADELAKACARHLYSRDIAAQTLGITINEVKPGYAELQMTVRPDMLNGHAICHGGFIFALADTAFAYACNSYNKVTVAQGCDIDYLKPGREGDVLIAVGQERNRSNRTGLYDIAVSRAGGETIAQFRGRAFQLSGEVIQKP